MPKFRVAYGNKNDIPTSINNGTIHPGSLIIAKDTKELYFYDTNMQLDIYKEKYRFNSLVEATNWITTYNCIGQVVSIYEGDKWNIYVVGEDNQLSLATDTPDWEAGPSDPGFIKNKPATTYLHEQRVASSEWLINHNLEKMPSITVVDSANSIVIGDVEYIDINTIMIRFKGAFSGKCYLN